MTHDVMHPGVPPAISRAERDEKVASLQSVLREIGFYGGLCEIREDKKRPGHHKTISCKDKFATKILEEKDAHGTQWYKRIIRAFNHPNSDKETNIVKLWELFGHVLPYLKDPVYGEDMRAKPSEFDDYIKAFTAHYILLYSAKELTKYETQLFNTGQYLVNRHETDGALSLWSTEGMEASHNGDKQLYAAKTNHGGGKHRTSALVQIAKLHARRWEHRKDEFLRQREVDNAKGARRARAQCRRAGRAQATCQDEGTLEAVVDALQEEEDDSEEDEGHGIENGLQLAEEFEGDDDFGVWDASDDEG